MPAIAEHAEKDKRRQIGSFEPMLAAGDHLTREEFERRYSLMPGLKKAELIEGIVYMPSPVRAQSHAEPQSALGGWLVYYAAQTPKVRTFDNATVRLDLDNEPQPDLILIKSSERDGQTRISEDDYLEGAPELVVEIAASSRAYDLHQKKGVYRRNGVREYLAYVVEDNKIFWWQLREGEYQEISADPEGILKSTVFPGLWLNTNALVRGDLKMLLETVKQGCQSVEHGGFLK